MILITLALAAGLGAAPAAPPDTSRTIFGAWQFNKAASDDPNPYLGSPGAGGLDGYGRGTMGGSGGRGSGGMGGPEMGGEGAGGEGMERHGGPPPGGMRSPSAAQRTAHEELAALAIRAPTRLALSETAGTLTVVSDSAAPITMRTDGRKVKWITSDSVKVETQAKWENGRLVVQHDVHDAGKVTYTFYRSPDGVQLFVAVAVYPVGGPTRPVPFRRVYDPAAPEP